MDWRIVAAAFSLIGGVYIAIIAMQRWISAHISRGSRHPCTADIVYKDVCEKVQEKNTTEHAHLEDCLEGAETRTGERFRELKSDMNRGFDEVKKLVKER